MKDDLTLDPISLKAIDRIKVVEECAECMLCSSLCPAYTKVEGYAGPMVFVKIAKFGFDNRDQVDRLREAAEGRIFNCATCFRCDEVCPNEIPVRKMAITSLRKILALRRKPRS